MNSRSSSAEKPAHPLSVVMVIQTFYPSIGGAEKQCLVLSKALQERGVRVNVLIERLQGYPKNDKIQGVPVTRLGWGGTSVWHSITFMVAVFWHLIRNPRRYDIIHVHLAASHAVAAALAGKLIGKKVVVLIGGGKKIGELAVSRHSLFGRLKLLALGFLHPNFIILSETQRDELEGFGLESIAVHLMPNGVETKIYHPAKPQQRKALREALGWSGLVFLYTGRFSDEKIKVDVFEHFLKAWSNAFKDRNDVFFYLVGKGPLESDYAGLIAKWNLQHSVRLLPARTNVNELYQSADVFVLPSLTEGLSNSLLEAMASNLMILASRVSGIMDVIEHENEGLLFDPYSAVELENCLRRILNEPKILEIMGDHAGAKALEFSIEKAAEKYLSLYLKLK